MSAFVNRTGLIAPCGRPSKEGIVAGAAMSGTMGADVVCELAVEEPYDQYSEHMQREGCIGAQQLAERQWGDCAASELRLQPQPIQRHGVLSACSLGRNSAVKRQRSYYGHRPTVRGRRSILLCYSGRYSNLCCELWKSCRRLTTNTPYVIQMRAFHAC